MTKPANSKTTMIGRYEFDIVYFSLNAQRGALAAVGGESGVAVEMEKAQS